MKPLNNRKNQSDQVFSDNEIRANNIMAKFLLCCAVFLASSWLLNCLGIFDIDQKYIFSIFPVGIFCLIVPVVICRKMKGVGHWIKYVIFFSFIVTLAYLDSILTYNSTLFIILPIVFSCWYFSAAFSIITTITTSIVFTISAYVGAYINYYTTPDLNFYNSSMSEYIKAIMLQSFLPRYFVFLVVCAASFIIAVLGKKMIASQSKMAKVENELEMAKNIQSNVLPDPNDLEECCYRDFDLFAKVMPAREVGGDFYDFFYLDETHLALIIADVADKGIAASLYMMMSKLMLDNSLSILRNPKQILENVNNHLSSKNLKGMFVTVWLGILDLESGEIICANAGHEYPVIRRAGGKFELFIDEHDFVLGALPGIKYQNSVLQLNEGDTLFVFTDGITEATNPAGDFYGTDRMLNALNQYSECSCEQLINGLIYDISKFSSTSAQFDDMTMLAIRFLDSRNGILTVPPQVESLPTVQSYINRVVRLTGIDDIKAKAINVCVDEVFSNIVHYSSASLVEILCTADDEKIILKFSDNGIPFDPLSLDLPKKKSPDENRPGGNGIFITKSFMDNISYEYTNGMNELTLLSYKKQGEYK